MTLHIAISETPVDLARHPAAYNQLVFTPWIDSDPAQREQTLRLAVNRHLRLRGGFGGGERVECHVFDYFHDTTRHPSGRPCVLNWTLFTLHKTNADDPRGIPLVLGRP